MRQHSHAYEVVVSVDGPVRNGDRVDLWLCWIVGHIGRGRSAQRTIVNLTLGSLRWSCNAVVDKRSWVFWWAIGVWNVRIIAKSKRAACRVEVNTDPNLSRCWDHSRY